MPGRSEWAWAGGHTGAVCTAAGSSDEDDLQAEVDALLVTSADDDTGIHREALRQAAAQSQEWFDRELNALAQLATIAEEKLQTVASAGGSGVNQEALSKAEQQVRAARQRVEAKREEAARKAERYRKKEALYDRSFAQWRQADEAERARVREEVRAREARRAAKRAEAAEIRRRIDAAAKIPPLHVSKPRTGRGSHLSAANARRERTIKGLQSRLKTEQMQRGNAEARARRSAASSYWQGSASPSARDGDGGEEFDPGGSGARNMKAPRGGERWDTPSVQFAFMGMRISPAAERVHRAGWKKVGVKMPSPATIYRRTRPEREQLNAALKAVDGAPRILSDIREEYKIPPTTKVIGTVAVDATFTRRNGQPLPATSRRRRGNHGILTILYVPLRREIRPFIVHLCQTENGHMDLVWRKRESVVLMQMVASGWLAEITWTDGDPSRSAEHRVQYGVRVLVRESLRFWHGGDDPRLLRIVHVTLTEKMQVLRTVGVFRCYLAADVLHWLRTLRLRLLDAGHLVAMAEGRDSLTRDAILRAIPEALGIAGHDPIARNIKMQDTPAVDMFTLDSWLTAARALPDYARWLTLGMLVQLVWRVEPFSRPTRFLLMEMADAVVEWLLDHDADGGRLAERFRRAQPFMAAFARDQLFRGGSLLMAVAFILDTHRDVDIDMARCGSKRLEQFYGEMREGLNNDDRDCRCEGKITGAALAGKYAAKLDLDLTTGGKRRQVGGCIVHAEDPPDAICVDLDPPAARMLVLRFMDCADEGEFARFMRWLRAEIGAAEERLKQTANEGASIPARACRDHESVSLESPGETLSESVRASDTESTGDGESDVGSEPASDGESDVGSEPASDGESDVGSEPASDSASWADSDDIAKIDDGTDREGDGASDTSGASDDGGEEEQGEEEGREERQEDQEGDGDARSLAVRRPVGGYRPCRREMDAARRVLLDAGEQILQELIEPGGVPWDPRSEIRSRPAGGVVRSEIAVGRSVIVADGPCRFTINCSERDAPVSVDVERGELVFVPGGVEFRIDRREDVSFWVIPRSLFLAARFGAAASEDFVGRAAGDGCNRDSDQGGDEEVRVASESAAPRSCSVLPGGRLIAQHSGLVNVSRCCFANAVIQMIAGVPLLVTALRGMADYAVQPADELLLRLIDQRDRGTASGRELADLLGLAEGADDPITFLTTLIGQCGYWLRRASRFWDDPMVDRYCLRFLASQGQRLADRLARLTIVSSVIFVTNEAPCGVAIDVERSYVLNAGDFVLSSFVAFIRSPLCETQGHSIAFVTASEGTWFCVDDDSISEFSDQQVHGIFAAQYECVRPLILCFARVSVPVAIDAPTARIRPPAERRSCPPSRETFRTEIPPMCRPAPHPR
jgi:hypothetical protein